MTKMTERRNGPSALVTLLMERARRFRTSAWRRLLSCHGERSCRRQQKSWMTGAIAAFVMSPIMLLMTFREGSFEDGFQSLIAFGMATAILSYGTLAYWFASEDLTECIAAEEENGPDGDNAR